MKRRPPPTVDPGFVEFVAARSAALFRTAVLIVGDRHAAEDLVQGALERAYRHWDRVAAMDAPEAYVRRILANLAADHHRRRGRGALPLMEHDGAAPDAYPDVDEHDAVIRILSQLPPRMRAVLVLRYYDDLTEAQIAEALGISVGTVKSQAARALAKLREAMAAHEEERTA
ncbi:RNA polymerase, sigma-24 subunit, ECF subfamily [Catenulispora acidiphila DSM 44928]|uniref:RNA polymerase, sigma-24 subunit, ECF subfamily n=1 Tax=Catenulispora acidiphila (strain DSM 44928 / JCM 14897 / NBRC 102108 / NRRL B-24433 / ID139908) TaxID=479433 RepID=C7PZ57_CATAD|nr:SigE family RNA polymerase sigma factor [Catenulispora acidiphila]ACU69613.1 RNA polymerase, sigma-24 subunit, ECF subfamily [Catenulispora acidiphila DSM 44928]